MCEISNKNKEKITEDFNSSHGPFPAECCQFDSICRDCSFNAANTLVLQFALCSSKTNMAS